MLKLETYSQRVLEPLCKATETLLEPLKLMPNDYLLIGLDKEAKRFVIKVAMMYESKPEEDVRLVFCHDGIARAVSSWNPSYVARTQFLKRIP